MKLLILPTISDAPSNVRYALVDETIADPEMLLQRTIATVAHANRRYGWEDLARALEAVGFLIPVPYVVQQPWDVAHDLDWRAQFTVEFPVDAQHQYAGQRGTATSVAAGVLRIVLADHTVLTPWDQPFRLGAEGVDQITLGPLHVPREQFSDDERQRAAVALLTDAGFEYASSIP